MAGANEASARFTVSSLTAVRSLRSLASAPFDKLRRRRTTGGRVAGSEVEFGIASS